jgi:GAF domain-containing protein
VLNIAAIANDPHTASRNETFRSRDVRSFVLVPMVRDEQAIGAIRVSHHDVGAFSEERVRLLKTFAARPSSPSRMSAYSASYRPGQPRWGVSSTS